MKFRQLLIILAIMIAPLFIMAGSEAAGDLDDGISKATDDSMSANDKMGKPGTNINFIILESMAEAKKRQQSGDSNANFNEGGGDNNENSVVCEVGAKCDKVININIGQ